MPACALCDRPADFEVTAVKAACLSCASLAAELLRRGAAESTAIWKLDAPLQVETKPSAPRSAPDDPRLVDPLATFTGALEQVAKSDDVETHRDLAVAYSEMNDVPAALKELVQVLASRDATEAVLVSAGKLLLAPALVRDDGLTSLRKALAS